ncbi:MAG: hypothetical protein MJ132_07420 [Clostridia bacterium]|nr:hypothetical protein [Clostridia bacterium]
MQKLVCFILVLVAVFSLAECNEEGDADNLFGFSREDFTVVEEEDTHGGFLGDGDTYVILDCSNNPEAALKIVKNWKPLPLSENLQCFLYGGEKDGVNYDGCAEQAHFPEIKNGYYRFKDRSSEVIKDRADDSDFLKRYSINMSVAIYDTDTNMLYFYAQDT